MGSVSVMGAREISVMVDEAALLPDLALAAVRHGQLAELDERVGEVLVPERAVVGVLVHVPARLLLRQQLPVGVEGDDPRQVVVVVAVVQEVLDLPQLREEPRHRRRHVAGVLVPDVVGHDGVRPLGALPGEEAPVRREDLVGGGGQPGAERRAVAHPDGVRAGQDHQLLDGEVLALEVLDELGDGEGGVREVLLRLRRVGVHAVQPAGEGVEVDVAVAQQAGGVAGGVDEDVRAGDDAGAPVLHRRLDVVEQVEGGQPDVDRRRLLRVRVLRRRVQQHRRVTALHARTYVRPSVILVDRTPTE
ncbi:hypothetical protein D1007_02186 [Hordeum vulgare]|nr:hypothetical protein D1007_02186 [Hordeum vulgare]